MPTTSFRLEFVKRFSCSFHHPIFSIKKDASVYKQKHPDETLCQKKEKDLWHMRIYVVYPIYSISRWVNAASCLFIMKFAFLINKQLFK
ncbi:hypothetical protein ADS79_03865 [Brevibacillus reuszeri]|uniref:Uncharacterized protein n=1 Tax=Brevibacillus reuszeri TaxID=54915 RepID=A0A0K9YWW3_9BACL|nr:hypothetical protein ADS79_03865 [Brevibacillus reuszeri]